MKKAMSVLLCLLLFVIFVPAFAEDAPAPFQKVKELCLKSQPDVDGDYILEFDGKWEGQEVKFLIGYLPRFSIIGIGLRSDISVYIVQYDENEKEFSAFVNGYMQPLRIDLAIERAFLIFREIVSAKII